MTTTAAAARARDSPFFAAMGWLFVAAALVGFFRTFLAPLAAGRFQAPAIVFVHGGLCAAWLALLVLQVRLVRGRRVAWHRRAGWAALVLAPAMLASTVATGRWAMARDVAQGGGPTAVSALVGTVTSAAVFAGLVALALAFRRRPDYHKRFALIATIALTWPAWFRFRHYFPGVPNPEVVFAIVLADVWILVAMVHDRRTLGRVHPVTLWAGGALVADHVVETLLFDTPAWRAVASALAAVLG